MSEKGIEIGKVVTVKGQVNAESSGSVRPLKPGSPIYSNEKIVTGKQANVELQFKDDTVLSQGPNASITLNKYVYDENNAKGSDLAFKMAKGTFRVVTGKIAKEAPEKFKLESPLTSIGIRGTTTLHDIGGKTEKHGCEDITQGKTLVVQDQFGEIRNITSPMQMVDASPGKPLSQIRPVSTQEMQQFKAMTPITVKLPDAPPPPTDSGRGDKPPAEGQKGGEGGKEGGDKGEGKGEGKEEGKEEGKKEGDKEKKSKEAEDKEKKSKTGDEKEGEGKDTKDVKKSEKTAGEDKGDSGPKAGEKPGEPKSADKPGGETPSTAGQEQPKTPALQEAPKTPALTEAPKAPTTPAGQVQTPPALSPNNLQSNPAANPFQPGNNPLQPLANPLQPAGISQNVATAMQIAGNPGVSGLAGELSVAGAFAAGDALGVKAGFGASGMQGFGDTGLGSSTLNPGAGSYTTNLQASNQNLQAADPTLISVVTQEAIIATQQQGTTPPAVTPQVPTEPVTPPVEPVTPPVTPPVEPVTPPVTPPITPPVTPPTDPTIPPIIPVPVPDSGTSGGGDGGSSGSPTPGTSTPADNTIIGTDLVDTITGNAGSDYIDAKAGNDLIYASQGGDDTITGRDGNDSIYMGNALDSMDTIDGGPGSDYLFFTDSGLDTTALNGVTNVEYVTLGDAPTSISIVDSVIAAGYSLYVDGSALTGVNMLIFDGSAESSGSLTLAGGDADDVLTGGSGNDAFLSSQGVDIFSGGAGSDILYKSNATSDTFYGGTGKDRIDFSTYTVAGAMLDVKLSAGVAEDNASNILTFTGIEEVVGPTGFVCRFIGDDSVNVFWGGNTSDIAHGHGGDDSLMTGLGDDTLYGGGGSDYLSGGGGMDFFQYEYLSDGGDTIADFTATDDDFFFNTTEFGGLTTLTAGELLTWAAYTGHSGTLTSPIFVWDSATSKLYFDLDGPGVNHNDISDYVIVATLTGSPSFDHTDFQFYTASSYIEGTSGNDTLNGTAIDDYIDGKGGNDLIYGLGGDDTIYGDSGDDTMYGGDGDDTFYQTTGSDMIYGNAATTVNVIDYSNLTSFISLSYTGIVGNVFKDGSSEWDNFESIQKIVGTPYADTMEGSLNDDTLFGEDGNDSFKGSDGYDSFDGGLGTNWLDYSAYANNSVGLTVYLYSTITGTGVTNKHDSLTDTFNTIENVKGTIYADTITGDTANNSILGYDGDDTFFGSTGTDYYDGGNGGDTLSFYSYNSSGIAMSATFGTLTYGGNTSTFIDVETLWGSNTYNDILTKIESPMVVHGAGGADQIYANTSTASGAYSLYGDAGADTLKGSPYSDYLDGGTEDDSFIATDGSDTFFGGSGTDYANYTDYALGITCNAGATITVTDGSKTDTLIQMEVVFGTLNSDTFYENTTNDSLYGFNGNDTFQGNYGGTDTFDGGADTDKVDYSGMSESITINLNNTLASGTTVNDKLISIEEVIGSATNSCSFTGKSASINETFFGGSADDFFMPGYGSDFVDGGGGMDTLSFNNIYNPVTIGITSATDGTDVDTYSGIESIIGSDTDDIFQIGMPDSGFFSLDGGAGNDTLECTLFTTSPGVSLSYSGENGTLSKGGLTVTLSGFENITGTPYADEIFCKDTGLYVYAGAGIDVLHGGAGADTFYYEQPSDGTDSFAGAGDFTSGSDKIAFKSINFGNISAVDASNFKVVAGYDGTNGAFGNSNPGFVYDSTNFNLIYDADGDSSGTGDIMANFHSSITVADTDMLSVA